MKIYRSSIKASQFREFCSDVSEYRFYDKKTGTEIYKWELFIKGLTPIEVFRNYEFRRRK